MSVTQNRSVLKSVRLGQSLRDRLHAAARASGKPESEIMREGIERRCSDILASRFDPRLSDIVDIIGSVRGDGSGYSKRTGQRFTEALLKRRRDRP